MGRASGSFDFVEVTIRVPTGAGRHGVAGSGERNLKMIRETLGVNVTAREDFVRLSGDGAAVRVAQSVIERLGRSPSLTRQQVLDLIAEEGGRQRTQGWGEGGGLDSRRIETTPWDGRLSVYAGGRAVVPKTPNQQVYLDAIRDHDLVLAVGPAGTGKTYLAVAAAVHLLRTDRVKRLILTRPAVEAGEKLGFLPGDMQAKVNPYLRPLLDALHDMMDFGTIRRFMDSDVVEIVPLAFMRGRTLNNAMIILDEAQNATRTQMQMFLTRMGHGSKMVVAGDVTQVDLPDPAESGMIDAIRRLRRVRGVGLVGFEGGDVVRHALVQRVIEAYGHGTAEASSSPVGAEIERIMAEARARRVVGAHGAPGVPPVGEVVAGEGAGALRMGGVGGS